MRYTGGKVPLCKHKDAPRTLSHQRVSRTDGLTGDGNLPRRYSPANLWLGFEWRRNTQILYNPLSVAVSILLQHYYSPCMVFFF